MTDLIYFVDEGVCAICSPDETMPTLEARHDEPGRHHLLR